MRTWYEGHDKAYKNRKEMGWTGWSEKQEEIEESTFVLEKILSYSYVPHEGTFLELGCGAGNIALWMAQKGYKVYGVDISPVAIEWAKEKAVECNIEADFRVGNVLDLKDYSDGFFDFLLDGHCFHCIIGEDRKKFLSSAFRVLKKGGFFHIGTMCNDIGINDGSFDPVTRCTIYRDIASRYIGLSGDIINEIREGGFSIINWEIIRSSSGGNTQEELLVECKKM